MTNTPASFTSQTEFNDAVESVLAAAATYYDSTDLLMSDAEYDILVDRIQATVDATGWDDRGVLTAVAAGTVGLGDVVHIAPMLSLGKATTAKELSAFLTRIGNASTVVEPKLDGLAISVRYVNGELVQAATRGDGATGEDVTAQAQAITGLPVACGDFTGEVRGEVFMTRTDFDASNVNRVAEGGDVFKNPRNAVAGSLRKVGTQSTMSFAAYDVYGINDDSYSSRLAAIEVLGFQTARSLIPVDSTGDVQTVIAEIETLRPTLDFEIDGAVIKVDSEKARTKIGVASRHPKWALAWKYAAEETRSVLRGVDVAIGRSGRVSFTAVIDPVNLSGVTVGKATLHNMDFITANKLGIGSDVLVTRANDVIPRVVGLDTDNNATIAPYTPPTVCAQCDNEFDRSQVNWRCLSPECSAVGWVTYFASRDIMDIDGLGETVADALVVSELVSNPADLYDLTVNNLATLELAEGRLLGEKNAVKIHASIQESKDQPFNRVIAGLGIRMTGRSVGRWLASEFGTMDALRAATVAQIASIEKLGDRKAESIVNGLKKHSKVIDRLAAAGVNMGAEPAQIGDLPLSGQTYVVSGSVPGFTRTTVQEAIERLGGKASGSVSKATTALITSETTTSKALKAAEMGIPIIDPTEFAQMLG